MEREGDSRRHLPPPGFGEVLRAARRSRGWSYRVAAKRIGIAYGYLAELERGNRCPSETVADLLVSGLGMTGTDAETVHGAAIRDVGRDWPRRAA